MSIYDVQANLGKEAVTKKKGYNRIIKKWQCHNIFYFVEL